MEHHLAVKTQAVERYLLGEMLPEERDDFEEHYFACDDCAQQLRTGARFRANARELLRDPGQFTAPARLSWWSFPTLAPAAVCVMLLGVVGYLAGIQIPGLKRQLASQSLAEGAVSLTLRDVTRGPEAIARIPRGSGLVSLRFDILAEPKAPAYQASVASPSGQVLASPVLAAPQGDEPAVIQLRRDSLPAGRYTISVRGSSGDGPVLSQFAFEIQ